MEKNIISICNYHFLTRDINLDSIEVSEFENRLNYLTDEKCKKLVDDLVNLARNEISSAVSTTFIVQNIAYYNEKLDNLYFYKIIRLFENLAKSLQNITSSVESMKDFTTIPKITKNGVKKLLINEEEFFNLNDEEKDDVLKEIHKIFACRMNKFQRYYMLLKNIELHDNTEDSLRKTINHNSTSLLTILKERSEDFFALVRQLKNSDQS